MYSDCKENVLGCGMMSFQSSLQCAVHFAEQGMKVLYISPVSLSALPPPIHGVSPPSTAALSHIRFM